MAADSPPENGNADLRSTFPVSTPRSRSVGMSPSLPSFTSGKGFNVSGELIRLRTLALFSTAFLE
jgi:hypothetical protein